MADNLELNAGSGGAVLATDELGGVHFQRMKVNFGGDGLATDVDAANPLPVQDDQEPWTLRAAAGQVPGVATITRLGILQGAPADTSLQDVWENGGIYLNPTTARIHSVVSDSADDTNAAGIGARQVILFGLDAAFARIEEVVLLNGTTPVNTVGAFTRLNRMVAVAAGSTERNVGTITATAVGDGTISAQMDPEIGSSQMAFISVPVGASALISQIWGSVFRSSGPVGQYVSYKLDVRTGIDTAAPVLITRHAGSAGDQGANLHTTLDPPIRVEGPADLFMTTNFRSATNLVISAGFNLYFFPTP